MPSLRAKFEELFAPKAEMKEEKPKKSAKKRRVEKEVKSKKVTGNKRKAKRNERGNDRK